MAFPATIPAQGAIHQEDAQLFQVCNGKWKKRPGTVCVCLQSANTPGAHFIFVDGVEAFRAINRISVDAAIIPSAAMDFQMNFCRHDNNWLPCPGAFTNGGGMIAINNGRWRDTDWAMGHNSSGYWLTWQKDHNQRMRQDFVQWVHIDLVAISDTHSSMSWDILARNPAGDSTHVQGAVTVAAHPKDIGRLVFNASAAMSHIAYSAELS